MYQHKVVKNCFYGGVFRTPENKHRIVTTDEPFTAETLPSAFKPINYDVESGEMDTPVNDEGSENNEPGINATPSAIELANKYGIPLDQVAPTGENDRITKADVSRFMRDSNIQEADEDQGDEVI